MNSIHAIFPFKQASVWMFTDHSRGLVREPFVAGADTLIDLAAERLEIPNAEDGITILFSAEAFPGCQFSLRWLRAERGGNWYWSNDFNREAWFCPALNKFLDPAPKFLFAQIKPSTK